MEINDAPLLDLLQDISTYFTQMPPAELRTFAQHWHELLAYLDQDDTPNQAELVARLQQAVAASPLLLQERFDRIVAGVAANLRFTPSLHSITPSTEQAGLAPVRNEVIRAVYQVGQQLPPYLPTASA